MDKNRFSWNLSVWSEKLRKLGNGRQRLLILFLAGLLLVVLSIPVKEKGQADSIQTQESRKHRECPGTERSKRTGKIWRKHWLKY